MSPAPRFSKAVSTLAAFGASLGMMGGTAIGCTSIVLEANDGGRVYGRTMEFGVPLHSQAMEMPRGFANIGVGPKQLLNYVLTNFATIDEVCEGLAKIYVSNSPMKKWGGVPRAHMTLHDAKGGNIVVEYLDGKLVITDVVIGVLTNDPPFAWHPANIGDYANLSGKVKKPMGVNGTVFPASSSGNGLHGMPGSVLSSDRFVRASLFVLNTPTNASTKVQGVRAWHIMNNFDIPIGAVFLDASSGYGGGVNGYEFTEWTVVADLKNKTYSIRSLDSPQVMTVDFKGFDLNGKSVINHPLLK